MSKIFTCALIGWLVIPVSTSIAEPSTTIRHISKADLKAFCTKNKGQFTEMGINGDDGYMCEIKGFATWACSAKENCSVSKTMVLNRPTTRAETKTNPAASSVAVAPAPAKSPTATRTGVSAPVANIPAADPERGQAATGLIRVAPTPGAGAFTGSGVPTLRSPNGTADRRLP